MAAPEEPVIETRGLTKRYGELSAVDRLDLEVRSGEVFGILGPNGSGKTTTILMLLGLTEPTSGTVRVLGLDPVHEPLRVKAQVGYLPEQVGFYDELTARENLSYIAKLNGIPRAEADARVGASLTRIGLGEAADRPVSTFSRGMCQRLGLAELLLKEPQVAILDEPTLGLDPQAAREFLETIRGLKGEGITVLLASHLLYQVQAVCDRVGLFHRGRMVLEGTVPALARQVLGGAYRVRLEAEGPNLTEVLGGIPGVAGVRRQDRGVYLLEAQSDVRGEVSRAVALGQGRLLALDLEVPSLDEVYVQYFRKEGEHVPTGVA